LTAEANGTYRLPLRRHEQIAPWNGAGRGGEAPRPDGRPLTRGGREAIAMMSAKENTRRLFAADKPERVGLNDGPWGATIARWVKEGYPTRKVKRTVKERGPDGERDVEKEFDEPVPCDEQFGFDMWGVGGWYDMMALRGVNEVIEETDEWRVVRNGMGAALKTWKSKDGTPEHVDFRMTSREVWERDYRPHVLTVERDRVDIANAKDRLASEKASRQWTFYGTLFIWEHMRRSMGDLCMYESLVLDPDWIRDFNRVYTDHLLGHYQLLFDEAGVPDGVWLYEDLGFKQRLFCSPRVLEELIFPYYAEVVRFCHDRGCKVILHSCGFTMDALDLIVAAGFDGLHPLEVAAGNEIFKAAEKYGDRLVFVGGFDKRIIETGDVTLIQREATKFIRGMKERGARCLFGSDHSISTNTPYSGYLAFLDAYRREMYY
jgi:uroporphyrinogen decarboxylase